MDDDTVRLPRLGAAPPPGTTPASGASLGPAPPPAAPGATRSGGPAIVLGVIGLSLLLAAGTAGWWFWARSSEPSPPPIGIAEPVRPEPRSPAPAVQGPPLASEAEILEMHPTSPRVVRLREEPRIFVILFPDLDTQGAALNRVAALIEKQGLPRDRVLTDAELDTAVRAHGGSAATYYYGHNYRGEDLAHFFALVDRQGIALNSRERWLREQLEQLPSLGLDAASVAFVGVPGLDERVDARMRRAILHHELGHGIFFTRPVFAAHITRVWRYAFTAADRAALTAFLSRAGYDPMQEELMVNEAMAYLLFTPDERFFSAAELGLPRERLDELRAMMLEGAPSIAARP